MDTPKWIALMDRTYQGLPKLTESKEGIYSVCDQKPKSRVRNSMEISESKVSPLYRNPVPPPSLYSPSHSREDTESYESNNKRKRNMGLLLSIMLLCLLLAGLAVVLTFSLLDSQQQIVEEYPMIQVVLTMHILNKNYTADMANVSSMSYKNISEQLCVELEKLYHKSNLHDIYYGCRVISLRKGSILADTALTFRDTRRTRDIDNVINILVDHVDKDGSNTPGEFKLGDLVFLKNKVKFHLKSAVFQDEPKKNLSQLNKIQVESVSATLGKKAEIVCEHPITEDKGATSFKKDSLFYTVPNEPPYSDSGRVTLERSSKNGFALTKLVFNPVVCADVGRYKCEVTTPTEHVRTYGDLRLKVLPSVPKITVPDLIQGQGTTERIRCTAGVGKPPGRIKWRMKRFGIRDFQSVYAADVKADINDCSMTKTSYFAFVPSEENNASTLLCEVENDAFDTSGLFSTVKVNLLPDTICIGKTNSTVPHPWHCEKFIECSEQITVRQCPQKLCYDPINRVCGNVALTLNSVDIFIDEGPIKMTCHLQHSGNWSHVTIRKHEKSDEISDIVTYTEDGIITVSPNYNISRLFVDVTTDRYDVHVEMWIREIVCADAGTYSCIVVPGIAQSVLAKVSLKGKPSIPRLHIPDNVFPNTNSNVEKIVCEADVGHPPGTLKWSLKKENETEFRTLDTSDIVTATETGCNNHVRSSISLLEDYHLTDVKCEVNSSHTSAESVYSIVETIYLIPGDYCLGHNSTRKPHEYKCQLYIECKDNKPTVLRCPLGFCYNAATSECDMRDPAFHTTDLLHPCKLDQNGYHPHPAFCNKYIWCLSGIEAIISCETGSFYQEGDTCTTDISKSVCYKRRPEG